MDLRQLRYFLAIVESRSITRAAEVLCIAQPALSLAVKNLEEELGTQLLVRSMQGVKTTQAGELLYQHAIGIARQVDNTRALITQQALQPGGKVAIGIPYSTAHLISIELIEQLRADYPGIHLELVEHSSADLQTLVLHGRVDLAIVTSRPVRGLVQTPLVREQLFAVRHPRFALREPECSLSELASLPLVLVSPPNMVRTRLDQAFAAARLDYQLVASVNATSLLVEWVARGIGATVLPWSAVHEYVDDGRFLATPLEGEQWQRELWLCQAETLPATPAVKIVQSVIETVVARRIEHGTWTGACIVSDP